MHEVYAIRRHEAISLNQAYWVYYAAIPSSIAFQDFHVEVEIQY